MENLTHREKTIKSAKKVICIALICLIAVGGIFGLLASLGIFNGRDYKILNQSKTPIYSSGVLNGYLINYEVEIISQGFCDITIPATILLRANYSDAKVVYHYGKVYKSFANLENKSIEDYEKIIDFTFYGEDCKLSCTTIGRGKAILTIFYFFDVALDKTVNINT